MRSLLFAFLAISCGYLSAQSVSVGQWELRKRNANGTMTSYGVTAENGKAIGFTADVPAMLAVGGSLTIGSSTITSGTSGRALYNNSGVLGELDLASLYAPISHNQAWSTITSTPTTLAGYGITDAITAATAASTYAPISHNQAWSTITSTPTTLAGYGITDAITAATAASTYAPIASPTFTGTITVGTGGIVSPNPLFPTRNITITQGIFTWQNVGGSGFGVQLAPLTPTADRIVNFNPNGAIVSTADTGTVTNAMLAGSIALSKLATTGTASSSTYLRGDGAWTAIDLSSYLPLSGGTATGLIQFSGTGHAGLRLNNLTTTQRDALTPSAGMAIWNTSTGRLNIHNGTSWSAGMVRLAGDTMTGALNITAGTATSSIPPLNITQTWNSGATTFRGIEFAVTNTASNSASTLLRLLNGATTAFSVNASTGSVTAGASSNSATFTLQGSDRSATLNLGAFGNEFRVNNLQIGQTNAAIRFTDANGVARYGTIYGETIDVLAFRNGNAGTTGSAIELLEMTAPGTPSADRGRIYLEDNGSGKSRLMVKWADGTTGVILTQP